MDKLLHSADIALPEETDNTEVSIVADNDGIVHVDSVRVSNKTTEEIIESIKADWKKLKNEFYEEDWSEEAISLCEAIVSYGEYLKKYRGFDDNLLKQTDNTAYSIIKRCRKYM